MILPWSFEGCLFVTSLMKVHVLKHHYVRSTTLIRLKDLLSPRIQWVLGALYSEPLSEDERFSFKNHKKAQTGMFCRRSSISNVGWSDLLSFYVQIPSNNSIFIVNLFQMVITALWDGITQDGGISDSKLLPCKTRVDPVCSICSVLDLNLEHLFLCRQSAYLVV